MPDLSPKEGDAFLYRGKTLQVKRLDGDVVVVTNPTTGRDVSVAGKLLYLHSEGAWAVEGLAYAPKEG